MSHTQFMLFFVMIGSALGLIVAALFLGFRGRPARDGEVVPGRDEMRRHTVWGLFYVNPADPRGWVPKPYGIGYTVNLRTRAWIWVLLFLFFATLISGVLIAMVGKH